MSAAQAGKPVVAAFDFDGTLTRRDTLLPFLLHTLGVAAVARHGFILSPTLVGYSLGLIRNDIAKERVLARCLKGMEVAALRQAGERYAENVLPGLLRPETMQRF
ncbi:MAG: haloacid dehalogenase-like hydrolase, partial [Gallionella sp.]